MEYWAGLVVGTMIGVFLCLIAVAHFQPDLDNCAKTHNVYKCELVAVPVAGESK